MSQPFEHNQLIRARAPVRVDFAGGWTDVAQFAQPDPGAVVNATLAMYSSVTIMPQHLNESAIPGGLEVRRRLDEHKITIFSTDFDIEVAANSVAELEYDGNVDLIKAGLKRMGLPGGFSVVTASSAPPGSGLGTSASLGVALLGALGDYAGRHYLRYELAELASEIERLELGIRGGKQDHYASALGGVQFMEFRGEDVRTSALKLSRDLLLELEKNLVLLYTGQSRLSGRVHEQVAAAFEANDPHTRGAMVELKHIARETKDALLEGDLPRFGRLLGRNWECQKRLHPAVNNDQIERLFQVAASHGALGGKACGAGGGGCLMFYCPGESEYRVRRALAGEPGVKLLDFAFDLCGVEVWRAPATGTETDWRSSGK